MHIVHLACGMDVLTSVLLDLTDDGANLIHGNSRDRRLQELWLSYRDWCEGGRTLLFVKEHTFSPEGCLFFGNLPRFNFQNVFEFRAIEPKWGVMDRAARRLFTTAILRPNNGSKFCEVSQRICSATAFRYMLFWMCSLLRTTNTNDDSGKLLGKSWLLKTSVVHLPSLKLLKFHKKEL